jgi:glyoxylase-like metal-dependent hydrolase (beta-lactamase superfamily II)
VPRELPPTEKLGPGLWSLSVPIPDNPLGYTLVYLLDSDRGPVLVDAGWHDPVSHRALERGIAEAGFSPSEVHGVLVTHHHPDHHGLAGRVREVSGAWIALHREDAAVVDRHREVIAAGSDAWRDRTYEALHAAGAPEDEIRSLLAHQAELEIAEPAVPDRLLEDGQLVDVPGRNVRAVWTPGHSPGHTCFALEDEGRLLAGDHLLPTITPHVGLYEDRGPEADPLGDYLASLARIEQAPPLEVLPAHQHRFGDVAERIAAVRAHHDERLAELREALSDAGGATLWELAERMTWNRAWDQIPAMMRRVAIGEAAAHLRLLERRGEVEPVPGSAPTRYRLGRRRRPTAAR